MIYYNNVKNQGIHNSVSANGMWHVDKYLPYARHVACYATWRMDEIGDEMCPVLLQEIYGEMEDGLLQAIYHEMLCFLNLSYGFHGSENSFIDTVYFHLCKWSLTLTTSVGA